MKYSIVMPVYNVEKYLRNAVSDILRQTYDQLELILVDDCSADTSGAICDQLAEKDERIYVLHLPSNGGLSNARNQGLLRARGDYVLFLDPDDRYESCLLEEIEKSIRGSNSSCAKVVLFGLQEEYYGDGQNADYTKEIVPQTAAFDTKEAVRQQVMGLEAKTLFGYAWNKAYSLPYLKEQGFSFEKIVMIEDVLFNIEVFRELDSLNLIGKPLYHYAIRKKGSLTQKYLPDYFEIHEKRIQSLMMLHREWGMESEEELHILGNIYCRYFLSALQRNCSPAAGMTAGGRRRWVKEQFKGEVYVGLKERMYPENRLLKLLARAIRRENVSLCLLFGRGIYLVKERFPGIFSRLKQNR